MDSLVKAAQAGDFRATESLLTRYLPLIRQKVLYYGRLADYQDLLQQGRLIFLEILREYDNGRGVPFGAYLKEKFRWRLFHYIRDVLGYREKEDLFTDVPANTIQFILAAHAELEPEKADRRALGEAVKTLTPKQRLVLSLFYWDELSVREIAEKLHETPQGVRQLKARAEKHLRQTMMGSSPRPRPDVPGIERDGPSPLQAPISEPSPAPSPRARPSGKKAGSARPDRPREDGKNSGWMFPSESI